MIWNIYFVNFDDIINFLKSIACFFHWLSYKYLSFLFYKLQSCRYRQFALLICNLCYWSLFVTYIGEGYLQIVVWFVNLSLSTFPTPFVYIENNFDCNVYVWSPVPYFCLFHLSISWNRFNKYKTLLHTPSFAASYRYIKIVVTSAICYHTSVFYSIVLKWLYQLDSHYLYLQNTTRIIWNFIDFRTSSIIRRVWIIWKLLEIEAHTIA